MKDTESNPIKEAWNETFEAEGQHFYEYFLGWPGKKGAIEKVLYFVLLGWILTPAKNVVKLLTEFLLGAAFKSTQLALDKLKHSDFSSLVKKLLWLPLAVLLVLTGSLHFLAASTISPLKASQLYDRKSDENAGHLGYKSLSMLSSIISTISLTLIFLSIFIVSPLVGIFSLGLFSLRGIMELDAFILPSKENDTTSKGRNKGERQSLLSSEENQPTPSSKNSADNKLGIENNLNASIQEQNNNLEQTNTPSLSTDPSGNSSGQGSNNSSTSTSSKISINHENGANNVGNNSHIIFPTPSNPSVTDGADQQDNNSQNETPKNQGLNKSN